MQRIGGEEHASEAEFRDQPRHGGNLAGCRRDLLVRQDQRSVAGKRAQHVGGRLIVQVVEAAAQRLAIQRDSAPARCDPRRRCVKVRFQSIGITSRVNREWPESTQLRRFPIPQARSGFTHERGTGCGGSRIRSFW